MSPKVNRFPRRTALSAATLLTGLALFLSSGCSPRPGKGLKSCQYRFQTFTFTGMDAGRTHWQVDVAVSNPNGRDVTLTRMRYALLYQADTLLSGWNPERKIVPAKDSALVRTSLDLPNTLFARLPPGIWSQTDARFLLVADAYLHTWAGDVVVPQAVKETVHVNMVEQVAKYKEMLMQRFFTWPGRHLEDGGINAPDADPPGPGGGEPPREAPPGYDTAPDEHL
ncbi:MAG TPA: LEA type 2 family protein [Fibrobacteria bacterium]|nr:LEA type 2 family protein [Fibrobacteria bacterium]